MLQPLQIRKRYPPSLKVGGDFFFGREGPLEQLFDWVSGGDRSGGDRSEGDGGGMGESLREAAMPEPFILISGIGGVGKSQLASELLHRCKIPRTKIWLEASSRDELEREVKRVCGDFQAAGESIDGFTEMRKWLEKNSHWILVVDNLDEPELLWEFTPKNHTGTVIITSRDDRSPMSPPPKEIKLDILQLPHAQTLLQTLGKRPDDVSGSEKLAKALGCLPLGLVMASSLVGEKRGTLTFTELANIVEMQREEVQEFLEKRGELQKFTEYQRSVISLWRQQREFLCQEGLSRAVILMECLSFADYRQISFEICKTIFETCKSLDKENGGAQADNFENCLIALTKQSLCTDRTAETKADLSSGKFGGARIEGGFEREPMEVEAWYRIHELTQLAVRIELGRETKEDVPNGSRQCFIFNLMAWALFVGRHTSRWEYCDLTCRLPTPSGRNNHQLQLLNRWNNSARKPWARIEYTEVEMLILLCLWFERLFFQCHWSQRVLRLWLLNEIETRWPRGGLIADAAKKSLLVVIYDEKVLLSSAVSVLAHMIRSLVWKDGGWARTAFAVITKKRLHLKKHENLPPASYISMLKPFLPILPVHISALSIFEIVEYYIAEERAEEALPFLFKPPYADTEIAPSPPSAFEQVTESAGSYPQQHFHRVLSLLHHTAEAAWQKGTSVFCSATMEVKELREIPSSSYRLFSLLVGKARIERKMGLRVRACESLGMASSLLPSTLSTGNQKSPLGLDSPLFKEISLSPRSIPQKLGVCLEDLSAFFEIQSEMWGDVKTQEGIRRK